MFFCRGWAGLLFAVLFIISIVVAANDQFVPLLIVSVAAFFVGRGLNQSYGERQDIFWIGIEKWGIALGVISFFSTIFGLLGMTD